VITNTKRQEGGGGGLAWPPHVKEEEERDNDFSASCSRKRRKSEIKPKLTKEAPAGLPEERHLTKLFLRLHNKGFFCF
jgi:hypothetical protein